MSYLPMWMRFYRVWLALWLHGAVDRASKACGPLYQWAESQIKYATILRRIKPLRDEMAELEKQQQQLQAQQAEAVANVSERQRI